MLSDGLHADVTIQVDGQEVAAHRCLLAARSQYFRQLLAPSQHNVVHIDGHKLETVEFMLFHLYSGAMYVPEDVDLSDLLTLAVMLGHKQLIRMAEFAMRVRLCHMFHKPCGECIPGVLETLCTAADCDLDDLAARCLAWVTQNRVTVWADPSFSEITDEYRAWCFQEAATLSQDTVLDVLADCRRLSVQLPAVRWSQQVRDMVETLLSNSVVFLSRNLGAILVSDKFMSLAESGGCAELEQYLLAAADVQNSADAHTSLEMLCQLQSIPSHGWDKSFLGMLQRIKQVCNRRASGGQNYASLHLQRRTVRAQVPARASGRPAAEVTSEVAGRGRCSRPGSESGADESPRSRVGSRPSSNSSPESRSPYLRRKHLLGLDRDEGSSGSSGSSGGRRTNVRGGGSQAMTQSVVAEPTAAEPPGMNRSESFTIYKHE
ncbi:uncharacterized protein LOC119093660 [Pollicipes pollicipes]|uniref:uncharacterized protein LOC119093660 n=1 Tax=Pollicipes pollicipes TaxID=41117 RepID=UPI001884E531|nr:uncharacterized protein LOC119093660 [Pollicipes pollicipes]